jgi:hypothetical protein
MAEHAIPIADPAGISLAPSSPTPKPSPWWRIADGAVFTAWLGVVLFTLQYHEKWADEAQAWLIARDLDLRSIWFHELRYEGSPGLWHTILWIAQHVFQAKYGALGYIGVWGAAAGVAVLIFKAPFPRYVRWPLAFTYFMVYQYAVIARPYTVLPLLAFTAAIFFKDIHHPVRMTVVLILLANLSLHGTILAACLGLGYLIDAIKSWRTLDDQTKHRYAICIAAMMLTFVFLFIILKPTPDIEEFAVKREISHLSAAEQAQFPGVVRKLTTIISGGFLDWIWPSVAFVLLTGTWCWMRRRALIFALLVGPMIGLYGFVHGAAHHHGTAFLALITALWIAWPENAQKFEPSARDGWIDKCMVILLLSLCAVSTWDSAAIIHREYLYPYSGAEDAAKYLKVNRADHGPMFGFLFGVVGVQAYFDHNIFANIPTAYFHHGLPLDGTTLNIDNLRRIKPEYIVAYSQEPDLMLQSGIPSLVAEGYEVVHFSDGYYMYKRAVYEREVYFILRRTQAQQSLP